VILERIYDSSYFGIRRTGYSNYFSLLLVVLKNNIHQLSFCIFIIFKELFYLLNLILGIQYVISFFQSNKFVIFIFTKKFVGKRMECINPRILNLFLVIAQPLCSPFLHLFGGFVSKCDAHDVFWQLIPHSNEVRVLSHESLCLSSPDSRQY